MANIVSPADLNAAILDAANRHNVDPDLLRAVQLQENGARDATAVGPKPAIGDPNDRAVGLWQIRNSYAQKSGIDPTDLTQSTDYAAQKLAADMQRYNGDVAKAVTAYHGGYDPKNWGPKTQQYVQQVGQKFQQIKSNGQQTGFAAPTAAQQPEQANDLASALFPGAPAAKAAPPADLASTLFAQPAAKSVANAARPMMGSPPQAIGAPYTPSLHQNSLLDQAANFIGEGAAHGASGVVAPIAGGIAGLGRLLLSGGDIDQAAQTQANISNALTYEPRTKGGQLAAKLWDLPAQLLTLGSNKLGQATESGANAIGLSPQTGNALRTTAEVVPATIATVLGIRGALTRTGSRPIPPSGPTPETPPGSRAAQLGEALNPPPVTRIEPTVPPERSVAPPTSTARIEPTLGPAEGGMVIDIPTPKPHIRLKAQSAAEQAVQEAANAAPTPIPARGSPFAVREQYQPGEGIELSGNPSNPGQVAPLTQPSQIGGLPTNVQASRRQALNEIGLAPGSMRNGAVSGNTRLIQAETEMGKDLSPVGDAMKAQFEREHQALTDYANGTVQATGGTPHLDPQVRGEAILAPMEGLQNWFNDGIRQLYGEADARAQGTSAPLTNTGDLMANQRSLFVGNTEGAQLLRGIQTRMRELGIADAQGNPLPATVQQAESLRQYLNDQWQPRTSRIIGRMKDALDDDVTQAAGTDIYQQARALRAERARTLDEPTGVGQLLDASGPNGINRRIAVEAIGNRIVNMPIAQLQHIKDVLTNMPTPELQASGLQAWNEIRAHAAENLLRPAAGVNNWLPSKLAKSLNEAGRSRLNVLFEPGELERFQTLHTAGQALRPNDLNPSGTASAIKQHQKGLIGQALEKAPAYAGGGIGAAIGGPAGAAAGFAVGKGVQAIGNTIKQNSKSKALGKMLQGDITPPRR